MSEHVRTEDSDCLGVRHLLVRLRATACGVLLCSGVLLAHQGHPLPDVKKVYVEQFTFKKQAQQLRQDVLSQLRKLSTITLVSDPSQADAILSGGGEIWVRGYESLNPRSRRSPSDGTAIYSGFLSVELKDTKGETLWSDLVTPSMASEDISKELSKRLEKHLLAALTAHPTPSRP